MKTIITNYDPSNPVVPVTFENSELTNIYSLLASGTDAHSSARLTVCDCSETIVVCRHVDASNFCVSFYPQPGMTNPDSIMGPQPGTIVEVYAYNGPIEVFVDSSGTTPFLDGSMSVMVTSGTRFRCIPTPLGGFTGWARLD
jgi:hypothetical protein